MASTSTEGAPPAVARDAVPQPLDDARLAAVPGVLGRIARERAADMAEVPVPSAPPASPAAAGEGFLRALQGDGLSVIAEIKRSSPSAGAIADLDPVATARSYRDAGAAALSVLTEPRHFGGSLAHLRAVARATPLPAMRKEFVVHPVQIDEAAEAGACAVLLIAAVLGPALPGYLAHARAHGLAALVEVHDEDESDAAIRAGAEAIGVNNRDLRTLEVDLALAPRLLRRARGAGFRGVAVAESGYRGPGDLAPVRDLADAVLVGTALAGSGDPGAALAGWTRSDA